MNKLQLLSFSLLAAGIVCSCSPQRQAAAVNPRHIDTSAKEYVNPFPPNSYGAFVARKEYPKTFETYWDKELVEAPGKKKQKLVICLDEQRGRYYINDVVAIDFPVSSGVRSYPTPPGEYKIIHKKPDHVSNLYGRMYDAEGKCINRDAKSNEEVPEGGKFAGSPMPYWMRLTNDGLGLHVGNVARRPLSHGCIRLQKKTAMTLFQNLPIGTPVTIRNTPEEYLAMPERPLPAKKS